MAKLNFGGTIENVVTRDEFPVEKAREVMKQRCEIYGNGCKKRGRTDEAKYYFDLGLSI